MCIMIGCSGGSKPSPLPCSAPVNSVARTTRSSIAAVPDTLNRVKFFTEQAFCFPLSGLMAETEPTAISPEAAAAAEMNQGLLTPESQAKLLQGMMQGSGDNNPLGLNLHGANPSTAAPSTASSANPPSDKEVGDDMDTTLRDKRAAPENPGLPWNLQAEQSQTGKGGKFPRQESKGNTRDYGGGWSRDHRRSPGQRRQQWTSGESDTRAAKDVTDKKILNLCTALTNLVLRHEDQMSINRSQSNYVMFCQSKGLLTVVPEFIKAIQAWKEAKEKQPETITLPMRAFLLKQWLDLLTKRFEACLASDTSRAQAAEMLVLDSNGMVPYLEWDQQAKEMKVKKDREPMRPEQVMEMLTRMQALALQPLAVMRFHAIHKLGWQMSSEVVPMMLEIGGRTPEANRLWEDFGRLSHSGATRCVATSLRPDKMGRSALATAVQKLSDGMCAPSDCVTLAITAMLMRLFCHCAGYGRQVQQLALKPLGRGSSTSHAGFVLRRSLLCCGET